MVRMTESTLKGGSLVVKTTKISAVSRRIVRGRNDQVSVGWRITSGENDRVSVGRRITSNEDDQISAVSRRSIRGRNDKSLLGGGSLVVRTIESSLEGGSLVVRTIKSVLLVGGSLEAETTKSLLGGVRTTESALEEGTTESLEGGSLEAIMTESVLEGGSLNSASMLLFISSAGGGVSFVVTKTKVHVSSKMTRMDTKICYRVCTYDVQKDPSLNPSLLSKKWLSSACCCCRL